MFGLYDKQGILRYINSDKDACLAYAELFELGSKNYSLMVLSDNYDESEYINLDQNQVESNN